MKGALQLGGARASLFEITMSTPIGPAAALNTTEITFLAKAASLPPDVQGVVEVPYQGRKIKVAGNRTFPEWQITVLNDEDFLLRNAFEQWHQAINLHRENIRGLGATSEPASYKGKATVRQLSKEGSIIRAYEFEGVWPSEVAAIQVDWATTDAIEEFTVTLQYDIWVLGGFAALNP